MLNIPIKTLGGSRYWADKLLRCGWRIQQHIHTGHPRSIAAVLNFLKTQRFTPPPSRDVPYRHGERV